MTTGAVNPIPPAAQQQAWVQRWDRLLWPHPSVFGAPPDPPDDEAMADDGAERQDAA